MFQKHLIVSTHIVFTFTEKNNICLKEGTKLPHVYKLGNSIVEQAHEPLRPHLTASYLFTQLKVFQESSPHPEVFLSLSKS